MKLLDTGLIRAMTSETSATCINGHPPSLSAFPFLR